jgi:hypothetical protein
MVDFGRFGHSTSAPAWLTQTAVALQDALTQLVPRRSVSARVSIPAHGI